MNAGDVNGTLIDDTVMLDGTPTNTTHHDVEFPVISGVKSSDPVSGTGGEPDAPVKDHHLQLLR